MVEDARRATLLAPFAREFLTYDLEFVDDGETIDLVSIGMVSGDGRRMYAINREMDQTKILHHDWMRNNVWPHLPRTGLPQRRGYGRFPDEPEKTCRCAPVNGETGYKAEYACHHMNGRLDMDHPDVRPIGQIRRMVSDFIYACHPQDKDIHRDNINMWAWYGAYDHVRLAQCFGPMIELPAHVPMLTHDLKSEHMRLGSPEMPKQAGKEHNALADAIGNHEKAKVLWQIATDGKV